MVENTPKYPPVPADDLRRTLTTAQPDTDQTLPHIGLVGDTYTITVSGDAKNATSTLTISNAEVATLAAAQLKANGVNATVALAAPDKVVVTAAGSPQPCR